MIDAIPAEGKIFEQGSSGIYTELKAPNLACSSGVRTLTVMLYDISEVYDVLPHLPAIHSIYLLAVQVKGTLNCTTDLLGICAVRVSDLSLTSAMMIL